jgi:hypothetical protein
MGQPTVSSVTWHAQTKRIFRVFYETVGQQIRLATKAKTALTWNHTKKSKSRFTSPRTIAGDSSPFCQIFGLMGWLWIDFYSRFGMQNRTSRIRLIKSMAAQWYSIDCDYTVRRGYSEASQACVVGDELLGSEYNVVPDELVIVTWKVHLTVPFD